MEEPSKKQKQAKMVYQSSSMENLPSPILIEIISRLPLKTVMALRCVCKSLLDIVSDSHFKVLYSTRAPTELWFSGTGESSTTLCVAEYVFEDDSITAVDAKSNVVFELPNFSVRSETHCNFAATATVVALVNSCCGLVCYRGPSGNRFVVVCNPITREYVMFPCPARMDKNVERQGILYGLGFNPKDSKFKLLRMIYRKYEDPVSGEEKSRLVGEIYTFSERGPWRTVANCPHIFMTGMEEALFHEGALHWYCTQDDVVVTFDFDTELFGKLVPPPRPSICDMRSSQVRWSLRMGVFEGCLYNTCRVGDIVDIWALKEYGQDSWVKMFSIPRDVESFTDCYEPFKYLQNGEVLMFRRHGCAVCFNPDTGSVRNIGGLWDRSGAVFVKPTLVSLKVLLGDKVVVHTVKPWYRKKAAPIPRLWTSPVALKEVVKADKDSKGCVPGSSAPRSSLEAYASTSQPVEVKLKEDMLPTILASQQGGADVGSFGSRDLRLLKDRPVDQSTSGTQKLVDEIETLKAENKQKEKTISNLGKTIAKLKKGKKKDHAFMKFLCQQMLNVNPNMPTCPMPSDSSSTSSSNSSDDSD